MTHSGGKVHHVGDRAQRYEITFDRGDGIRRIFGWASDPVGAKALCGSVRAHPVWCQPAIRDRALDRCRDCGARYVHESFCPVRGPGP